MNWPLQRIILSTFANRYVRAVRGPARRRTARAAIAAGGARRWRCCRSSASCRTATRFSSRCCSRRPGAARGSAKCPSSSSNAGRACRSCLPGDRARVASSFRGGCSSARGSVESREPQTPSGDGGDVVSALSTGDTVGTFMRPIATGLAARGHAIHMVLPWHPKLTRGPIHEGVHFHPFHYSPVERWHVFGYAGALRADVASARHGGGGRAGRRSSPAGGRPHAWRATSMPRSFTGIGSSPAARWQPGRPGHGRSS